MRNDICSMRSSDRPLESKHFWGSEAREEQPQMFRLGCIIHLRI